MKYNWFNMKCFEDRRPASDRQIDQLIALGHDREKVINLTGLQARQMIGRGRKGEFGPAPYAWKKNPASDTQAHHELNKC